MGSGDLQRPMMDQAQSGQPRQRRRSIDVQRKKEMNGYVKHLKDRAKCWLPLFATAVSMVVMGVVCWWHSIRISTQQDIVLTLQTAVVNGLVSMILLLLHRTDWACCANVRKWLQSNDAGLDNEDFANLKPEMHMGNCTLKFGSGLAILLPLGSLIAATVYGDVPVSDPVDLPLWLNGMFGVGAAGYIAAGLWLLLSTMSRPVRQTWQMREDLIKEIKDANSAQEWDGLVKKLATTDHELKQMWSPSHAGGLWCVAIFVFVAVAMLAIIAILDHSLWSHADIVTVLSEEFMNVLYFFLSTTVAAGLGLVLASTTFVSPFYFGSEAGPDADPDPNKQCCILSTAIFSTHAEADGGNARVERMRFTQVANQLSLGAKFFGVGISHSMVFRLYFQMGVAAPTILTALRAGVAARHGSQAAALAPSPAPNHTFFVG